jgi:hypothetical protein
VPCASRLTAQALLQPLNRDYRVTRDRGSELDCSTGRKANRQKVSLAARSGKQERRSARSRTIERHLGTVSLDADQEFRCTNRRRDCLYIGCARARVLNRGAPFGMKVLAR